MNVFIAFSILFIENQRNVILNPQRGFSGTLRFRIIVPVRLFISRQEWPKNSQNLAILCSKSQKLQSCMPLLGTVQLFGTAEYTYLFEHVVCIINEVCTNLEY